MKLKYAALTLHFKGQPFFGTQHTVNFILKNTDRKTFIITGKYTKKRSGGARWKLGFVSYQCTDVYLHVVCSQEYYNCTDNFLVSLCRAAHNHHYLANIRQYLEE